MEYGLRFFGFLLKLCGYVFTPFAIVFNHRKTINIPPITNDLLKLPVVDLAEKIRTRQITSEEVVIAYVKRIREVNPLLNAVVEDRFNEAIEDARKADHMVATMPELYLIQNYPILGVPFTVKESCSLKGMSFNVGSVYRKDHKTTEDGLTVSLCRKAGGIPLLVSNTPEFCTSWETHNYLTGRTLNPYNAKRTSGGSSGGEGALIGAGASLFGIGSDVAGSIRIPALFNGIFGHKPTGNVVSNKGHFPNSSDECFSDYLVTGPMCRYAKDLPTLLHIMAGPNASKLRLGEPLYTKDVKIHYMEDAGHSLVDIPVKDDIKIAILKACQHFKNNGLDVKRAPFDSFQETLEMGLSKFFSIEDVPLILRHADDPKKVDNLGIELIKNILGSKNYTFAGLFFVTLYQSNGFIPKRRFEKYSKKFDKLRNKLLELLGDDGVLFYPTFPTPTFYHNLSFTNILGVMYTMIFNVLGFPATHVPMGLNSDGLPIGIQVIAAPYQDRLCLLMAGELEAAFGGWKPPF